MDLAEALAVLGVEPGADADEVRSAYLAGIREHHPDLGSPGEAPADRARRHLRTSAVIDAYEVVRRAMADGDGTVPEPPPPPAPVAATVPPATPYQAAVEAELLDGETIAIDAPPGEAFALLYEAASRVGNVAYVDRQLDILEIIVRFEGGPSCSVVMTTQGRAHHTEVFCTMESIEADPTPAITPVVEALVDELRGAGSP